MVAVLLSGASADGAKGMRSVREAGGLTIAQDPAEAEGPLMPQSASDTGAVDKVLKAEEIGRRLVELGSRSAEHDERRNRNVERGRLTSRLPGQSSEF